MYQKIMFIINRYKQISVVIICYYVENTYYILFTFFSKIVNQNIHQYVVYYIS